MRKKLLSSTFNVAYNPHLGKYLGVFVDNDLKKANFSEMVEKINQKLSGWKAKLLSQAGRLQLIKSVLSSTPLCRMSSFSFPKKYLQQMNATMVNFF